MSRILKGAAATVVALSFASLASAHCGTSTYCGQSADQSTLPALSSWSGQSSYNSSDVSTRYTPSAHHAPSSSMSSYEADANYGTGSISESYSSYETPSHSSASSVHGLGQNEGLQATDCPTTVLGNSEEGQVVGCYNVVKSVPKTTYYRVVRPVIHVPVPVPVPVAVPYTSPCMMPMQPQYSQYRNMQPRGQNMGCNR